MTENTAKSVHNLGYHAHIYYNPTRTRAVAEGVCAALGEHCQVEIEAFRDTPSGPHPRANVLVIFTPDQFEVDAQRRSQCLELCHCGIAPRWLVVHAEAAAWRAESSIRQAQQRAYAGIEQHLLHVQARRFDTPAAAHAVLAPMANTWKYHQMDSYELIEHKRYATKGRPRADAPCQAIEWPIHARVRPDAKRIGDAKRVGACDVLGTKSAAEQLTDVEVMAGSKGQAEAEGGCRFLKDP